VLEALRTATAHRPGETLEHMENVSRSSMRLAQQLAQEPDWIMFADPKVASDLGRVAAIHDLGLVGVTDEIITNPGFRSPSEHHAFAQHPLIADGILDQLAQDHGDALPFLRLARASVRHHHEHFDGTGFPDGLKENKIPAAARIIAVAVAYDELRLGHQFSHQDALRELQSRSRTAFDPAVVEALQHIEAQIAADYEGDLQELVMIPE
jgi:putative two-component system response regulator